MKKTTLAASLACLLLAACSTPPQSGRQWQVSPLLSVQDGGGNADGWYQLGRVQLAQGRLESAESALRHALELAPHHGAARSALGVLLARRGDLAGAVNAFQAAVQEGATAGAYNNLGYALYLQGKYAEAVDALGKASVLEPGNGRAWHNLGLALEKAGDPGRARLAYGHAEALVATVPPAVAIPAGPATSAPVVDALVELAPGIFELRGPGMAPAVRGHDLPPAPTTPSTYRLEIANGNGVPGLARRIGAQLAAAGLPTARLGNQKPYVQSVTEIQYREGYAAAASQVGEHVPGGARLRAVGEGAGRADIRLVLGRDLREPSRQAAMAVSAPAAAGAGKKPG